MRAALTAGDYAVLSGAGTPVAVVERKSLADLAGALNNGTLVFELAKLAEMPRAAVMVEDRYGAAMAEYESEQHEGAQMRATELPLDYHAVVPEPPKRHRKAGA